MLTVTLRRGNTTAEVAKPKFALPGCARCAQRASSAAPVAWPARARSRVRHPYTPAAAALCASLTGCHTHTRPIHHRDSKDPPRALGCHLPTSLRGRACWHVRTTSVDSPLDARRGVERAITTGGAPAHCAVRDALGLCEHHFDLPDTHRVYDTADTPEDVPRAVPSSETQAVDGNSDGWPVLSSVQCDRARTELLQKAAHGRRCRVAAMSAF
ncbi:hypothetical protein BC628DRAFT_1194730 [Trametes gibbosa]|nr:hypothetical protein BC628DRAFT_1194730 [Trametes gibbosa]